MIRADVWFIHTLFRQKSPKCRSFIEYTIHRILLRVGIRTSETVWRPILGGSKPIYDAMFTGKRRCNKYTVPGFGTDKWQGDIRDKHSMQGLKSSPYAFQWVSLIIWDVKIWHKTYPWMDISLKNTEFLNFVRWCFQSTDVFFNIQPCSTIHSMCVCSCVPLVLSKWYLSIQAQLPQKQRVPFDFLSYVHAYGTGKL